MLALSLAVVEWPVLVVGAGSVGTRRARALAEAGARVRVVAPEASTEVRTAARQGRYEWLPRPAVPADVDGHRLVAVAVPERQVAVRLAERCRQLGILCNVADDPPLCDFHFPAVVRRGPVQVAVSTGGCAPGLSACLRQQFDALLPADLDGIACEVARLRSALKARGLAADLRKELLQRHLAKLLATRYDAPIPCALDRGELLLP